MRVFVKVPVKHIDINCAVGSALHARSYSKLRVVNHCGVALWYITRIMHLTLPLSHDAEAGAPRGFTKGLGSLKP
jgi:hypothetical protein